MKMKNLLLLLLCLMVVPAWAADAAGTPPADKPAAQAAAPTAQPSKKAPKKTKKKKKTVKAAAEPMGCPTGCSLMNCPPPTGPVKCCNTSTFQPC